VAQGVVLTLVRPAIARRSVAGGDQGGTAT
jgi:hypothetical protein